MKALYFVAVALFVCACLLFFSSFDDRVEVSIGGPPALHLQDVTPAQAEELIALGKPNAKARKRADDWKRGGARLAAFQASNLLAEVGNLKREVERLRKANGALAFQLSGARNELLILGSPTIGGPIADWIAHAPADAKPTSSQVYMVSDMLEEFPARMTEAEVAWIGERTKRNDWKQYAPTISEAVIQFLGPMRIAAEVPKADLERLQAEWFEEGYFKQ